MYSWGWTGYEVVLSSLHPDLRTAQSQLFTTSNGSHTRCEAVFPVVVSLKTCSPIEHDEQTLG